MLIQRIRKLVSLPYRLRKLLTPDPVELKVYQYFKKMRRPTLPSGDVILVQCVENLYYFSLFGQVITSLREQSPIRVEQFVLNSLRVRGSSPLLIYLRSSLIQRLIGRKWVGLYKSFCDDIGYRSTGLRFPLGDVIDALRAFACWRSLINKDVLISLVIDEIPVGDLINDSYLRCRPAATVNLEDTYLWTVIWQAHRDVRRAKHYFGRVRPKLYLTSYSGYIQHGIAVRTALKFGVRVFSILYYLQFCKELTLEDWTHIKNPSNYAAEFALLENQEQKLTEAETALAGRISGMIDNATVYMKKSAYKESEESVPDVRGAIVVFLHDFFDCPHVYRYMVFPDFWEWICFTIETLEKSNIHFFVKPHPSQINLSDHVLSELKNRYPNAKMISPNITNKQLAQAGLACAVTVHGTVAHEMAYLGVPTIACGDNPHISFSFCNTTKSKAEYAEALNRYAEIKTDRLAMHRQSLIFYFMHNLRSSADERALLQVVYNLHQLCEEASVEKEEMIGLLTSISEFREFKVCISKLTDTLSGKIA